MMLCKHFGEYSGQPSRWMTLVFKGGKALSGEKSDQEAVAGTREGQLPTSAS